jgi:PPP family 3-phenylpropionic acid transporter
MPNSQSRRGFVIVWLLYFFEFGAIGLFFPFLNIFYLQNGLSGTEIGLVGTAGAVLGVLGASTWGYLGDRLGRPRLLLCIGSVAASLVLQVIPLVHGLWGYLALTCLSGLIGAGIAPLVDSLTLGLLGNNSEEYGRYRLGGTIGYILATAFAGMLYQRIGLQWIFLFYGVVMVGFAITALFLPPTPLRLEAREKKGIGKMIRQPVWLVFVASVFLVWIAASGIISFMGIAIKSLGGDDGLVGLAAAAGALAEIPFMLFSGRWMRRFGAHAMLGFGMLAFAGRLALYGWMPVPTWAIFIGMLNGPTYVFFWNSAVNYARNLAPAGYEATAQGLLGSITNLGTVVSALFCGFLFDQMGARGMFWVLGACSLLGFLIFSFGQARRTAPARS